MRRLETMLAPGEEIRAEAGLGDKVTVYAVVPAAAVVLVMDWTAGLASWLATRTALTLWQAWIFAVMPVGLGLFLALRFTGFLSMLKGGARLLVTDRRVLWWAGPLGLYRRSLDRTRLASATGYMGGDLLLLHLAGGKTLRLRDVKEIESVVRALAVPARIWRAGLSSETSTRLSGFNKLAFLGGLAAAAAAYLLLDSIRGAWLLPEEGRSLPAIGGAIAAAMIAWALLFDLLRHFVAARRLDHRSLRYFACSRLDRRYQGREPWPESGGPPWIWWPRAYRRWLLRRAYGGRLDCSCEAQEFDPQGGDDGAAT